MGPLRLLHLLFTLLALTTLSSAQIASALDPPTLISNDQPTRDSLLLLPLNGRLAKQRIDGLLVPSKLWSRQTGAACPTNYTACQGSQFCCPDGNVCCSGGACCGAGTYCTTVGGVQGCCKLNHICNQLSNECTVAGQVRCPNENYCCAAGDTCYRDANNNPRCSSNNLSGSTPTSQSSEPSITATPLQTQCQLTPAKSRGSLSRRKQPPMHPASKRKRWFG